MHCGIDDYSIRSGENAAFICILVKQSNKCFSNRNKLELFALANAIAFLPVFIGNNRLVYWEVFCIWRYVRIRYLVRNNDFPKVVATFFVFIFALFFRRTENLFYILSYRFPIGQIHSITRHRPRKSSACATLFRYRRLLLRRVGLLVSMGVYILRGIEHC